jgi:hypothetical protein
MSPAFQFGTAALSVRRLTVNTYLCRTSVAVTVAAHWKNPPQSCTRSSSRPWSLRAARARIDARCLVPRRRAS